MQFDSLTFLAFFIIVLCGYYLLRGWTTRKGWLLAASYLFYSAWNPLFVFLIAVSTLVDWVAAGKIISADSQQLKKRWLAFSLVANLGLLGFFKYTNFLLETFNAFLAVFDLSYRAPAFDIVLPVGISFYTFQTLSYTIDSYRGKVDRRHSFLDYALFVAFFPQLVAGPIVRAMYFLPQCLAAKRFEWESFATGWMLLLFGLTQKIVFADTVFAPLVDTIYENAAAAGAIDTWTAVFAYSGQIFFDFSGYSLCAIGAAACLGFSIPENFRAPYAAAGPADFWRRWHISLSTWFRDYLYIPLGGNRRGGGRTIANLGVTMLIGGLWHGASWLFVLWGALHGLYLIVERLAAVPARIRAGARVSWNSALYALITFVLVSLTWIVFRAQTLETARSVSAGLFRIGKAPLLSGTQILTALALTAGMLVAHGLTRDRPGLAILKELPAWAVAAVASTLLVLIFFCTGGDERAFIYFQF